MRIGSGTGSESLSFSREEFSRNINHLRRGGPDESNSISTDSYLFIHHRLAITGNDESGVQPKKTSVGSILLFNGEIYNYRELIKRHRLQLDAAVVCDTEVLSTLYSLYGLDCIEELVGMYAISIYEPKKNELYLLRDRYGVKPLYYSLGAGEVLFSSEIRAIRRRQNPEDIQVDRVLDNFLIFGFTSAPETFFEGVYECKPGNITHIMGDGRVNLSPIGSRSSYMSATNRNKKSLDEFIREADRHLDRSIGLRCNTQTPYCFFLSGGIDSALTARAHHRVFGSRCIAYTVKVEGAQDETDNAKLVAEKYNFDLRVLQLSSDWYLENIELIESVWDQPFADSSKISTLYLSRKTHREYKIAISSDGGDEAFGGYRKYAMARRRRAVLTAMAEYPNVSSKIINLIGRILPQRRNVTSKAQGLLTAVLHGIDLDDTLIRYLNAKVSPELVSEITGKIDSSVLGAGMTKGEAKEDLCVRLMERDLVEYIPFNLMRKVDQATMYHGQEAREPLLDVELQEWAKEIPLQYKVIRNRTKVIPREILARDGLAKSIVEGAKFGFGVPLHKWFLEAELRDRFVDVMSSSSFECVGLNFTPYVRETTRRYLKTGNSTDFFDLYPLYTYISWRRYNSK